MGSSRSSSSSFGTTDSRRHLFFNEGFMIRIRQYRPAYFDVAEGLAEVTAPDTAAVFEIPFVKRWADNPDFDHWSLASPSDQPTLMANLKNGEFWVVAFVQEGVLEGIPMWVYPEKRERVYVDTPETIDANVDDFLGRMIDDI